jgi:membrane protein
MFSHFPPLRLKTALSLSGLSIRELAVRTWTKIDENEILTRAAGISFYALLAFIPFLALFLTLTVELLPDLTLRSRMTTQAGDRAVRELDTTLKTLFPSEAYTVIKDQIARLQEETKQGTPMKLLAIGLPISLWLASSLFLAVIDALNRIYGVRETRSWLKLRLTAMAMTIIQAVILIGSLLLIMAWPLVVRWFGLSSPAAAVGEMVQLMVIFIMVLISFALAFYVGPDADQKWEWITPGSLAGSLVFLMMSYLFRIYVQYFGSYPKTYGSLGGVMVLAFWFWISSIVLLAAGQINQVIEDASPLGKHQGQKAAPAPAPVLGPPTAEAQPTAP